MPGPLLRRGNNCTTVAYSTIRKCSATGTTVTSSVTATATAYQRPEPCGCTESGCHVGGPPAGAGSGSVQKRGDIARAPRRVTEPQPLWLTPLSPENYNDDAGLFMRGETAVAYSHETTVYYKSNTLTTSYVVRWGDQRDQHSMEGLWGCVAVVIVSDKGCLMLHMVEDPIFTNWNAETGEHEEPDPGILNAQLLELRYHSSAVSEEEHWGRILNFRSQHPQYQALQGLNRQGQDLAQMGDLFNNGAKPEVRPHAHDRKFSQSLTSSRLLLWCRRRKADIPHRKPRGWS
ncbi:hypothetical protein QBC37DRAFT_298579 [Rhypophila decipiens]|uniref:Uncharacterized protein n=1 Tax=Rhypophila decipiens TaxID=261697 RepID=A0AAN6XV62_9PEZI|nr:hypothetical protein QBC37DRAFT_298579 [Rhypophila decipiens]